jgi:hypothetical protein
VEDMIIFVATSKRFYGEAIKLVNHLKNTGVKVHHPYFDLNPEEVDADPELKSKVTIQHFPGNFGDVHWNIGLQRNIVMIRR